MATLWDELLPLVSKLSGRVLDAGCGNGCYARRCKDEIPSIKQMVGLDIQPPTTVFYGTTFLQACPDIPHVQAPIESMPFEDATFDGIICWHTLEHSDDARGALREFFRILRPGGLAMISMPGWGQKTGQPRWLVGTPMQMRVFWNAEELAAAAAAVGLRPMGRPRHDSGGSHTRLFRRPKR